MNSLYFQVQLCHADSCPSPNENAHQRKSFYSCYSFNGKKLVPIVELPPTDSLRSPLKALQDSTVNTPSRTNLHRIASVKKSGKKSQTPGHISVIKTDTGSARRNVTPSVGTLNENVMQVTPSRTGTPRVRKSLGEPFYISVHQIGEMIPEDIKSCTLYNNHFWYISL